MTFIFVIIYACHNRSIVVCFRELDDIMRGRQILVDLIERNALPVFKDINTALKCSAHVLQKVRSTRMLSVSNNLLNLYCK